MRPVYLQRRQRKQKPPYLWFFLAVGVMAVILMGLFLYDRIELRQAKNRMQEIRHELKAKESGLSFREQQLQFKLHGKKIDGVAFDLMSEIEQRVWQRRTFEKDAEWIELKKRVDELKYQLDLILQDHPEYR